MHLESFRIKQHWSMEDLARELGIGLRSAYRYVRGERIPPKAVMVKIRRISGGVVTADDFYSDQQRH
jgi:transcriptional regulator with XRE-family HTH domain